VEGGVHRHLVAHRDLGDLGADAHHLARELAARHDRQFRGELAQEYVQIGAAQAARGDPDDDGPRSRRRARDLGDDSLAHGLDDGGLRLTAPNDRPWTSLSWAANPAASTGREMTNDAAHTLARNRPWLVMKLVRKTGAVSATTPVSTRANSSSFQLKMKQISAVAAMPGRAIGATTRVSTVGSRAPSICAASMIATGTSDRNDCI